MPFFSTRFENIRDKNLHILPKIEKKKTNKLDDTNLRYSQCKFSLRSECTVQSSNVATPKQSHVVKVRLVTKREKTGYSFMLRLRQIEA